MRNYFTPYIYKGNARCGAGYLGFVPPANELILVISVKLQYSRGQRVGRLTSISKTATG